MTAGFFDEIISDGVYKFYVDGQWRSAPGKTQKIGNPSTGETAFTVTGTPTSAFGLKTYETC